VGLDSYASRTPGDVALSPEDEEEFATSGIELCGGLFSGGGGASFRGKVYLDVIDRVAGILIYQDWTTPEDVRRIWVALERADEEAVAEDEASFEAPSDTAMTVPIDLVPKVRELIGKHRRTA